MGMGGDSPACVDRLALWAPITVREVTHRTKVGLTYATLALDGGLLDLQVSEVNDGGGRGVKPEGARTSAPEGG
jgi:hypothetical protein